MASDKVIEMDRPKSSLLDAISRVSAKAEPTPEAVPPPAPAPSPAEELISPEDLSPLPRSGDAFEAHARVSSRPLATIFFLPKGGLPDGFSYAAFERVRMIEGEQPGASPALLVRFNGSVVYEVTIEGRNLLGMCNLIGRHVIQWVREHPTGRDAGNDQAVFVRHIVIREIERP